MNDKEKSEKSAKNRAHKIAYPFDKKKGSNASDPYSRRAMEMEEKKYQPKPRREKAFTFKSWK
jgi:hypothetical protein